MRSQWIAPGRPGAVPMDPTFATKILFVQCSIGTAALVALALELPQQAWALHL